MAITTRNDAVRYVEERLGADGSRALAEVFCTITRWQTVDQLSEAEWNDVLNDAIPREADGEPRKARRAAKRDAITRVYVTVTDEGIGSGHRGQIRSARTGRVLQETKNLRPYGMQHNARVDAETIVHASDRYRLVDGRGGF